MMGKNSLWLIGQFASLVIGLAVGLRHGSDIGLAVAYALLIFVDIRQQTTPNK